MIFEKLEKFVPIISLITAVLLLFSGLTNFTSIFKPTDLEVSQFSISDDKLDVVFKNPTDTDIFIKKMDIQIIEKHYRPTASILPAGANYKVEFPTTRKDNISGIFSLSEGEYTSIPITYVVGAKNYDRFTVDLCGCKCNQDTDVIGAQLNITFYYDNGKSIIKKIVYDCD